jgi:aminoglycoside phosphotransferase (APT) family kinase protein
MAAEPHDPALPHLREALDGRATSAALQALFRRTYPERALAVSGCEVTRLYHKPGRYARVTYRVCGSEAGAPFARWFVAELAAAGESPVRALAKAPARWPGCGAWKPACAWPECNAALLAFPWDPKLRHLGPLLEPEVARAAAEEHRAGLGLGENWRCAGAQVRPVKYIALQRCALRLRLEMESDRRGLRRLEVFSKTYRSGESRYVYDALVEICRKLPAGAGSFAVPRPLAHLDRAHTIWQEAFEGEGLRERAAREGWPQLLGSGLVERVGRLLAALHRIELPADRLRPADPPERILAGAAEDVAKIGAFAPAWSRPLERAVERLRAAAPDPRTLPSRTLHGTFKLAQIVCRRDELALVDFDSVARGDPLYDLAEFTASLVQLRLAEGLSEEIAADAVERLRAGYAACAPWGCDARRLAWYVVPFLLAKLHSSLKRHATAGTGSLAPAAAILEEWLARAGA